MRKIALINCFFGPLPWYFDFFLKSCDTNSTVDFIIFSDHNYKKKIPKNVEIISFNLNDFNLLASIKLQFKIDVKTPYKLCDFKPAYGVIFSEYLKDYDFWGMCDIDIILGRIRSFMTPEILNQYDVISTRHNFVTGWFMLFRNTLEINNLFKKSKDYLKVFSSDTHFCFDECNFKYLQLDDEVSNIFEIDCEIESMEHVLQKEIKLNQVKVYYDLLMLDELSGKIKWDNGILSYDNEFEILLYHLIFYKTNKYSQKAIWKIIPNVFHIDKHCFRKNKIGSLLGFLKYFYFNILKVRISKMTIFFKFYISNIFVSKQRLNLLDGKYKNQLGDDCFWIMNNQIFFEMVNYKGRKLICSNFNRNVFFLKNHPWLVYRYFIDKNGMLPKIQLLLMDGTLIYYELKIETKNEL